MADLQLDWIFQGAGERASYSKIYTGSLAVLLDDESAPDAATTQFFVPIDVSAVKAITITSTKNVTLKTNSSGTPANTIVLVANVPYEWCTDSPHALLLTVDVTSIFIVNASGGAAIIRIDAVVDASP